MSQFVKWPHIEGLSHALKELAGTPAVVRTKVKLHGTNAAVRIDPDGTVTAQARNGDISLEKDNCGFAAWVKSQESVWRQARERDVVSVVHGEWCGPGINTGDACSRVGAKTFFIFSVTFLSPDGKKAVFDDPADIGCAVGGYVLNSLPDVRVIPWHGHTDLPGDRLGQEVVAGLLAHVASEIGAEDPYIKKTFGVSGPGEGLVLYIYPSDGRPRMLAKVKVAGHGGSARQRVARAPLDPEVFASRAAFVSEFVSEARLLQGLEEGVSGVLDVSCIPQFLAWVGGDVKREGADSLEASGLTWKDVAKDVNSAAVAWYKGRCA